MRKFLFLLVALVTLFFCLGFTAAPELPPNYDPPDNGDVFMPPHPLGREVAAGVLFNLSVGMPPHPLGRGQDSGDIFMPPHPLGRGR